MVVVLVTPREVLCTGRGISLVAITTEIMVIEKTVVVASAITVLAVMMFVTIVYVGVDMTVVKVLVSNSVEAVSRVVTVAGVII